MSDHTLKSAIDGAYSFQEEQQRLLDCGRITEDEWFTNLHTYLSSYYLAAGNPRGQSGHGGDEARYRYTQEMVLSALHKSGTFIDIGCANGYLLEKLVEWASARGVSIEVYGLDISAEMIQLARQRLPLWTDRFYVGNALFWTPPRRYDFVCVRELNYVPRDRRRQFFEHLVLHVVCTGGRLILGPRTEERNVPGIEDEVRTWGYPPTGLVEKPHQEHDRLVRRLFWFAAPQA